MFILDKSKEDVDALIKEVLEKKKLANSEKAKEEALLRVEYDRIHDGLSAINFHISIFLLLIILTILNLPSTISWAKNYQYVYKNYFFFYFLIYNFILFLQIQSSFTIRSIIDTSHYSISFTFDHLAIGNSQKYVCLFVFLTFLLFWSSNTCFRNGYKIISNVLYILAAISVLYCQDSVYRLNGIISTIMVVISVHQIVAPKMRPACLMPLTPEEAEAKERMDKFRDLLG